MDRASIIRSALLPLLSDLATFGGSNYGQEAMLARREVCLHRVKDLISLCFSTTNAVLNSYSEFFNCELVYLPTLIDRNRAIKNRHKSKKYPSIIFSGRLTKYRKTVLEKISRVNLNAYPLEGGIAWSEDSLLHDTKFKLSRLRKEEDVLGTEASRDLSADLEMTRLPAISFVSDNLYRYSQDSDHTAAYEIYIPQKEHWPYSSPNRTLLSIESGFIPLDFGIFADHDLNQVALSVEDRDEISALLTQDIEENFAALDKRVTEYAANQKKGLQKIKGSFAI